MSVQSIHLRFKWRVFHFYCLPHPLFSSPKIASIFDTIAKIYCLNSDLTVSGMAALKIPVSKFYFSLIILAWSIAHSYPSFPASLSLPYQPPLSPLPHTHFSLSIEQDPLCWDNSEGDYCHWILNQDTISTAESASEPPDSWTNLAEIFMFWHSVLQCPLEKVSLSVEEEIPLGGAVSSQQCHTSEISQGLFLQVQELCDPWDKRVREENMFNYVADCNIWLQHFFMEINK